MINFILHLFLPCVPQKIGFSNWDCSDVKGPKWISMYICIIEYLFGKVVYFVFFLLTLHLILNALVYGSIVPLYIFPSSLYRYWYGLLFTIIGRCNCWLAFLIKGTIILFSFNSLSWRDFMVAKCVKGAWNLSYLIEITLSSTWSHMSHMVLSSGIIGSMTSPRTSSWGLRWIGVFSSSVLDNSLNSGCFGGL